eukprot:s397_g2.t1
MARAMSVVLFVVTACFALAFVPAPGPISAPRRMTTRASESETAEASTPEGEWNPSWASPMLALVACALFAGAQAGYANPSTSRLGKVDFVTNPPVPRAVLEEKQMTKVKLAAAPSRMEIAQKVRQQDRTGRAPAPYGRIGGRPIIPNPEAEKFPAGVPRDEERLEDGFPVITLREQYETNVTMYVEGLGPFPGPPPDFSSDWDYIPPDPEDEDFDPNAPLPAPPEEPPEELMKLQPAGAIVWPEAAASHNAKGPAEELLARIRVLSGAAMARLRPRLPALRGRRPLTAMLAVLSLLVLALAGSGFVSLRGSSLPRSRRVARGALDVEGLASFASFSVLAGSPIPLGLGALFRRAEDVAATTAPTEEEATWPEFALPSFGSEPTPKAEEVPECTGPRLRPRRMARVIGMALAPLALIWALLRAALTFHAVETSQGSRTRGSPSGKGHRALLTASRAPPSKMSATSLALVPIVAAAAMQVRGGSALAQKAERASGVPPALMGLAAWLLLMFAIQHSWVVVPFLSEAQHQYFPIVATFVAGYAVIVLEEQTEINKAATALILGVLVWALVGTGIDMTASEFDTAIAETLQNVAEVVFFLLGALTIVEIMDAHKGFDIITSAIKATNQRDLLLTIGFLTFLLSSVLNNLTVVIVMVSLLQRLVQDDDFRMKLGGLVVVASNAGGAWTPIGDITTTMLYIGGQVTTVPLLTNLFVPSSLCLLGAMGYELLFVIEGRKPFERRKEKSISTEAPAGQQLVFWGGLLGMVGVPVFTAFTKCPAWTGMMLVLGLLGLITSLLHEPGDDRYSLKGALKRVEVPDALFFLGVLFAVGALERVGLLKDFAEQLSQLLPDDSLVAIFLGFASAVVDNVPLVAATQGMYDLSAHPANDGLWNLITYCAATGGSLLVIGSAAGVAFMGMEKEVSFGWYVRSVAPAALAGYLLGVGGVLGQQALGLSVS